jgi:hypothetical protein
LRKVVETGRDDLPGLIEEIQRDAIDRSVPVATLLRKLKLAAAKLKLQAVEEWVESELNGYTGSIVPDYRILRGKPRAFNPYNGWIPIMLDDPKHQKIISSARTNQSVAALTDLLEARPDGMLAMPLSPSVIKGINKGLDVEFGDMAIHISRSDIVAILDTVRNRVLDWAIRMENEGIVGEGISFSNREQEKAKTAMTHISIGSIGNFAGNLGEGNRSTAISANQSANEGEVFIRLAGALEKAIPDKAERENMLRLVSTMAQRRDNAGLFAVAYGEFITSAANHMQIIAPFLPALLPFLAGGS